MDELWGCFKHVGMSWDMIMKLPIQDRRLLIQKHNKEQEEMDKMYNGNENGSDMRHYEGEALNTYAQLEQRNKRNGG